MFILVATMHGDDLIPSSKEIITSSLRRGTLESLQAKRKLDRDEWLMTHGLLYGQEANVITSEEILEIPCI